MKQMPKTKVWMCKDCNVMFESVIDSRTLSYCPACGKNAIDHTEYYIRIIGNIKEIKLKNNYRKRIVYDSKLIESTIQKLNDKALLSYEAKFIIFMELGILPK